MRQLKYLLGIIGLSLFAGGCDLNKVEIDPFVDSDKYYTVFGYLDTGADTHFLRITPLRDQLEPVLEPLDATVTTTDLGTGEVVTWRDSLVTLSDQTMERIYYSSMNVLWGHSYRLDIAGSDGSITSATTSVPPQPVVRIGQAGNFGTLNAVQPVTWEGITYEPQIVEVWYRFLDNPRNSFNEFHVDYLTEYETRGATTPDGWNINVQLSKDRDLLREEYPNFLVSLYNVGMRVVMRDENWMPPGDRFDREVLAQPGTMSNVENGYGFFGSLGQFDVEWVLEKDILDFLGYIPPIAEPGE